MSGLRTLEDVRIKRHGNDNNVTFLNQHYQDSNPHINMRDPWVVGMLGYDDIHN